MKSLVTGGAGFIGGDKISIPKKPGEPDRSLADITNISSELNWKPKISINQGVKMMVEIIKDWKDAPVWTPESIKEATNSWFKYLGTK